MEAISKTLSLSEFEAQAMRQAARWHDRGKAHAIFQDSLPDGAPAHAQAWAKAAGRWKRYARPHFRHELASALAVLDSRNGTIPDEIRNLVAYLVAAHHGKVRLSIRSLPNEDIHRRAAATAVRSVSRGAYGTANELPETDLGGGVTAPAVMLSLEPMELGLCAAPPFADLPSWAERMLRLRDQLGPFRLTYLETVVRAADMRASRDAERREAEKLNRAAAEVGWTTLDG